MFTYMCPPWQARQVGTLLEWVAPSRVECGWSLSHSPTHPMAGGHHGGGGGNGNGLTFGFSHLLAEKMGRTHQLASSLLSNGVGSLVGIGSASSSSSSSSFSARSEYMVTRCPSGTLAQLNHEGVCSWLVPPVRSWRRRRASGHAETRFFGLNSGTLGTTHAECPGYEENDRRTVCVQNLQRDMQNTGNRMRLPTCGLGEFFWLCPPPLQCFAPRFGPHMVLNSLCLAALRHKSSSLNLDPAAVQ